MAGVAYNYTPYTSQSLDTGGESGILSMDDLTSFTGIPDLPTLPTGKQVIFFSLGMVCIIAALALIEKTLITEAAPDLIAAAKDALA